MRDRDSSFPAGIAVPKEDRRVAPAGHTVCDTTDQFATGESAEPELSSPVHRWACTAMSGEALLGVRQFAEQMIEIARFEL